ncbi:MAG: DEAD/DEAH box helicase [Candidatus Pacebacteria bacterium]|nr:DEAD/DEAH box helicase [Candidatus Paceibacterota bacterium]
MHKGTSSARPTGKRSFHSKPGPVTRSGSGFRYTGPAPRPSGGSSSHSSGPARSGGFKSGGSRFGKKPSGFAGGRRSSSFQRNRSAGSGSSRFGQRIDFSKFVKKAEQVAEVKYIPKHTFADFPFSEQLHKNIAKKGFIYPTPIQDQSIEHIIAGRDFFGLANTGTGKTGAFILPLIDRVFRDKKQKVLIMAPTRELAQQIQEEFRSLSFWMQIFSVSVVGGMPMGKQISEIRRGVHFVIGTPGRITDLVKQKALDLTDYENIVLDEADRMLDMGFRDDMTFILGKCAAKRQTLFFSATLSPEIRKMTEMYLKDPLFVSVVKGETSKNIDQDVVRAKKEDKLDRLHDVLIKEGSDKVLIFRETKRSVDQLEKELRERGFKVAGIHGDKRNRERMRMLDSFKKNETKILIATDVAARGLDIPNVTHVINYDIPNDYDTYVHRIGRTGRADKKGIALTFIPG